MPAPRLKPLIHWAIYKGYKVRYTKHSPSHVQGVLTDEQTELHFDYDPIGQIITVPDGQITINQYGWEIDPAQGEGTT